ncbi:hypothetical protein MMC30_004909 [Trapelia coarctata]|nr:hypothetical protein [Trapelia coarctata]
MVGEAFEAWTKFASYYLSMDRKEFSTRAPLNQSLVPFLVSYAEVVSNGHDSKIESKDWKHLGRLLRRQCFSLTHRLLGEFEAPPAPLLEWTFLGDFCTVFRGSSSLRPLIEQAWNKHTIGKEVSTLKGKNALLRMLEKPQPKDESELNTHLRRAAVLLYECPPYGRFLMVGSEIPDAIAYAWFHGNSILRIKLVNVLNQSLLSLLIGEKPNVSLFLDHLYALKANTETQRAANSTTLLTHLISTTSFWPKLQTYLKGSDGSRAQSLVSYLQDLRTSERDQKTLIRLRRGKGKSKDQDEYGHSAMGELHVHKMSLVTQIQDLFPDLGSGFIVKLLDEYNDDTEEVIAHLLNDSLPPHLKNADRQETLEHNQHASSTDHAPRLSPRPTPPLLPVRKNVFDNDDFDNLNVSISNVHIGRKNPNITASDLLDDTSNRPNKAAILSALAAFDADDDERDDTYDVEDVGGTVDTTMAGTGDLDADLLDKNEEALFSAYKMSPEVFGRDANTRRGKARIALKTETRMTDEAIEGWAIMLGRDPRRLRRMEEKLSMATGTQRALASTAYREGAAESGTEGGEDGAGRGGRGGFRGRSGGRGRGRGKGGDVAGPADDRATQVARQRKDANKGSRANHNRRDQRARKVARAGFPG